MIVNILLILLLLNLLGMAILNIMLGSPFYTLGYFTLFYMLLKHSFPKIVH